MFITNKSLKNQKTTEKKRAPRMFCFSYLSLCDKLPQNSDLKEQLLLLRILWVGWVCKGGSSSFMCC